MLHLKLLIKFCTVTLKSIGLSWTWNGSLTHYISYLLLQYKLPPKFSGLQPQTFTIPQFCASEFGHGFSGWFWLWVPHELQLWQDLLLTSLMGLFAGLSSPCGSLHRLPECPPDMAAGFPQSKGFKREQGKATMSFMN